MQNEHVHKEGEKFLSNVTSIPYPLNNVPYNIQIMIHISYIKHLTVQYTVHITVHIILAYYLGT